MAGSKVHAPAPPSRRETVAWWMPALRQAATADEQPQQAGRHHGGHGAPQQPTEEEGHRALITFGLQGLPERAGGLLRQRLPRFLPPPRRHRPE